MATKSRPVATKSSLLFERVINDARKVINDARKSLEDGDASPETPNPPVASSASSVLFEKALNDARHASLDTPKPPDVSSPRMKHSDLWATKTVELSIGLGRKPFTVLEDLICVSPFFRDSLQPWRREIEGDCMFCHDALEGDKPLTFCRGPCGNNYHQECVDEWKRHKPQGRVLKCPLDLQPFDRPHGDSALWHPGVEAQAFKVYYHWLNNQPQVRVAGTATHLIKAYCLGELFKEPDFCKVVLKLLLRECVDSVLYPNANDVTYAYGLTCETSPLRKFLVCMYTQLSGGLPQWGLYPPVFHRDLSDALMRDRRWPEGPWTWETLAPKLGLEDSDAEAGS
jgi:hypothetical protein